MKALLTKAQRTKLSKIRCQRRYMAKLIAAGHFRKGGKYYREYEAVRDAPRRRKYYLLSKASIQCAQSRKALGEERG
jgi:hypothetical protein